MKYDYDLIVIGLGPAGMAISIMAAEMGLKVCAIEKHKVGGECMNVGCIPSKALLRIGRYRSSFDKLVEMGMADSQHLNTKNLFENIAENIDFIREEKTMKMFDKVDMIYQQGSASFLDAHTVVVADKKYSATKIFICAGTNPAVPLFPGVNSIDFLTNETVFSLDKVPESMIVIGGGSIACEMAQAFSRLGTKVTIIIRGPRLMWREDTEAMEILEAVFFKQGITILRHQKPTGLVKENQQIIMQTDKGHEVIAEKLLIATGRSHNYGSLKLGNAGVEINEKGMIKVNNFLQTSVRHIYAAGDCNGYALLSHAAMHQGMVALMNSMLPGLLRKDFKKYVVPWTVFTEPQISYSGISQSELDRKKIRYEIIKVDYRDYGAAIAESIDIGFIKAFISPTGKILGVCIVGEGSGEIINQWSLAIQKKLKIYNILMLQHSFPTMGFLAKRVAETWMMKKMESNWLKKICQFMFRL